MNLDIKYYTGYAGTGKSTLLQKLIKTLSVSSSVILAPTHKALERITNNSNSAYEFKTIHSLLGLIPTINEQAKDINNINTIMKLEKPLEYYSDIAIDEAGMMNEDMLGLLIERIEELEPQNKTLTLHLFLDTFQTKPVKGVQISVPIPCKDCPQDGTQCKVCGETVTNLKIQYRSESPDIVETYTRFVDYLISSHNDLEIRYSENIKPFNLKHFRTGDRILAYTNNKVGIYNKTIAKQQNITSFVGQYVQLGNMGQFTVLDYIEPTISQLMEWFMSGKLKLQNAQISVKFMEYSLNALIKHPSVKFVELLDIKKVVPVIEGIGDAAQVIKTAKDLALKDKKKFADVYTLNRAFIMDYTFASTIHKAQGQEFDNVFIDKKDLQISIRNGYYDNYARLMYVGISRGRQKLYI